MTKTQRQRMIADWLREHRVGSQEELVARLSLAGITATQATVSAIQPSWIICKFVGIGSASFLYAERKAIVAPLAVQPAISTSSARPLRKSFRLWVSKPTSFHMRRSNEFRFSSTISASENTRPAFGFVSKAAEISCSLSSRQTSS